LLLIYAKYTFPYLAKNVYESLCGCFVPNQKQERNVIVGCYPFTFLWQESFQVAFGFGNRNNGQELQEQDN
jgi:hypothetical protein